MKIIDLTHTFTNNMPVYPGDPKSSLEQVAFIEKDTFNDHKLTTVMHIGTHMDAPLHMIKDGKTMDEISLNTFIGNAILIDVRGKEQIDSSVLNGVKIEKETIVLLFTGFGDKYKSVNYFEASPAITEDFAQKMVELEVKMVGMDMSGPDHDTNWPVHKLLLSNDTMILENLTNLDQLVDVKKFEVIALPIKLNADAAPVRVIAKILE